MKTRDADTNLDPTQYDLLNSEFYSADPAAYFRTRTRLLFLAAGANRQLDELLTAGVFYEGLILKLGSEDPEDPDDERQLQNFLITESEVLLHHASEVLLRLY